MAAGTTGARGQEEWRHRSFVIVAPSSLFNSISRYAGPDPDQNWRKGGRVEFPTPCYFLKPEMAPRAALCPLGKTHQATSGSWGLFQVRKIFTSQWGPKSSYIIFLSSILSTPLGNGKENLCLIKAMVTLLTFLLPTGGAGDDVKSTILS